MSVCYVRLEKQSRYVSLVGIIVPYFSGDHNVVPILGPISHYIMGDYGLLPLGESR